MKIPARKHLAIAVLALNYLALTLSNAQNKPAVANNDNLGPSKPKAAPTVLKGHFEGTVSVSPISGRLFRLENVAAGVLSHVGSSTAAWAVPEVEVDMANLRLNVGVATWSGTITAANGDEIRGIYSFREDAIPFTILGDL